MKKTAYPTRCRSRLRTFFLPAAMLLVCNANAQIIAQWDPAGLSSYGPSPWSPTASDPNLTVDGLTRGSGITTPPTAVTNGWGGENWTGNPGHDVGFTITVGSGYVLDIDSMDLAFYRPVNGPDHGMLSYSINGGPFILSYGLGFISTATTGNSLPTLHFDADPNLHGLTPGTTIRFLITPDTTGSPTTGIGPWFIYHSSFTFNDNPGLTLYGSTAEQCPLTTGHFTSGITATSVTVHWDNMPGALGYEYAYDDEPFFPSAWIFTASNSVTLPGLDPGTDYFFFLRAVCDTGVTSNFTGLFFSTTTATGTEEVLLQNILSLYPNPASDLLQVNTGNEKGMIQVYDITGHVHMQLGTTGTTTLIHTASLPAGVYTLRYICGTTQATARFTKQ